MHTLAGLARKHHVVVALCRGDYCPRDNFRGERKQRRADDVGAHLNKQRDYYYMIRNLVLRL